MLLFVFLTIVAIIFKSFGNMKIAKLIPFLAILVFIPHVLFEGIRWQLYPIYIIIVFQFLMTILFRVGLLKKRRLENDKKLIRMSLPIVISGFLLTVLFSYAFPVYKIPTPSGPHEIGTISFDLIDDSREAIYSEDITDNRKIKLQVWYPAQNVGSYEQVPWLQDGKIVAEGVSKLMGFPDFVLSHTSLVKSNAYLNAPISNEKEQYPVIILSHGWTGFRNIHTDVAELLASNGFVVVAIDHTYGSAVTAFNDGEVAYVNDEALPDREETPNFLTYANTLVKTFAGDIQATLDQLEMMNTGQNSSPLKGKLDLANIGVIGHSTGGGAAVATALHDKRIKALIGLDAWVEPIEEQELDSGLQIPSLFLRSHEWEQGYNNEHLYLLLGSSMAPELYQINNTGHQDFSMIYMYSPLSKYFNITGKLDGREGASIQHDFILTFFEKNIYGQVTSKIADVAKQYEDVQIITSYRNE
ncbi:dienelactone hydrolase family protein [Bacillus sp. SM2101]|uniref:alpha/beta hydrolase n=1 Tax=Bacillus sp. SM2101 TaxID=2805366 RepID=UPI001BDE59F6|nr:dienelactone hydrolase family protein [Bacillus sp. SM2101]